MAVYDRDVPVDVLVRLARDEASLVRAGAAFNVRTPTEIVDRFDEIVRRADAPELTLHLRALAQGFWLKVQREVENAVQG